MRRAFEENPTILDLTAEEAEAALAPVFERLLEGYWEGSDSSALDDLLSRLRRASESAPDSGSRLLAHAMVAK